MLLFRNTVNNPKPSSLINVANFLFVPISKNLQTERTNAQMIHIRRPITRLLCSYLPKIDTSTLPVNYRRQSTMFCTGNNNNNNNNNNNHTEKCNSRFFTISSLRCELSPTCTLKWPGRNCVQSTCNTSSACHVQPAVCHLVQRDSSAIKFDRAEVAFMLALFYWLKPLTDEEGEETGVPGENPWQRASENATY